MKNHLHVEVIFQNICKYTHEKENVQIVLNCGQMFAKKKKKKKNNTRYATHGYCNTGDKIIKRGNCGDAFAQTISLTI